MLSRSPAPSVYGQVIARALDGRSQRPILASDADAASRSGKSEGRAVPRVWRLGRRWAVIASLVETCKLNGVEPFTYLRDVLERMVNYPANRLADLLLCNWKPVANA